MATDQKMTMTGFHSPRAHRVQVPDTGPSRTKQSFSEECDINNIMKKFEKTGIIDHARKYEGNYGDFTGAVDYHTAMNIVREADEMFQSIPATIRKRFDNDPQKFLEYVDNPENEDEMREMGLLPPIRANAADEAVQPPQEQLNDDGEVTSSEEGE